MPAVQPTLVPTIHIINDAPSRKPVLALPSATPDVNAPVWITNPVDGVVLRIDANSNTIAAVVHVNGSPDDATAGEGAVWALDRKHNMVFRIDPEKNRAVAAIPLPAGSADALAVGAGSVWVGMTGRIDLTSQEPGQEGEVSPPGLVVQIDPKTNRVLGQFPVQPVSRMVVNGSALWVLSRTVIDNPLQVIDLHSNQGMAVPLHNAPDWLPAEAVAVDDQNVWLFSTTYGKIYHGSPDGQIRSVINVDTGQPSGNADLLIVQGSLWAATPWGTLLRINPVTNHIEAKIELGVPVSGLVNGGNTLWAVSQQAAVVYRIDPQKSEVTAQIQTGSHLPPTVVPSPTPRVVIWRPCPDASTSRLKVGDLAYVTKESGLPNRVRKEPNREAEVLGFIGPGTSMQILEGPACSDGWVWWHVKNASIEGWTAEGDQESYWLVPLFP